MTQTPHDNVELIRRVLGANCLELALVGMVVDEQPDVVTKVKVTVAERGQHHECEGQGVGLVDALFNGLLDRYAVEYQSLRSIKLAGFSVEADPGTGHRKSGVDGVDAVGTVRIDVENSEGKRFTFSDASRSVSASTGRAVLAVVQYFVNAERAFITLHNARKDALDRHRPDLVARYTAELAEVVKSTSYAAVIESIKKELA